MRKCTDTPLWISLLIDDIKAVQFLCSWWNSILSSFCTTCMKENIEINKYNPRVRYLFIHYQLVQGIQSSVYEGG